MRASYYAALLSAVTTIVDLRAESCEVGLDAVAHPLLLVGTVAYGAPHRSRVRQASGGVWHETPDL